MGNLIRFFTRTAHLIRFPPRNIYSHRTSNQIRLNATSAACPTVTEHCREYSRAESYPAPLIRLGQKRQDVFERWRRFRVPRFARWVVSVRFHHTRTTFAWPTSKRNPIPTDGLALPCRKPMKGLWTRFRTFHWLIRLALGHFVHNPMPDRNVRSLP